MTGRFSSHPTLLILGGNDRSLWANRGDLISLLLAEGWDVHAALPPKGAVRYPRLHDTPIHRVPIERTGMNPLADLRAVRAIRDLVAELAPGVVLAYNPKPVWTDREFADFREGTRFGEDVFDFEGHDMFYWEHRMPHSSAQASRSPMESRSNEMIITTWRGRPLDHPHPQLLTIPRPRG